VCGVAVGSQAAERSGRVLICLEMTRIVLLAFLSFAIAGCSEREKTYYGAGDPQGMFGTDSKREALAFQQLPPDDFLAYEHSVDVDADDARLEAAFQAVAEACNSDRENQCTILHSNIDLSEYSYAVIGMRVEPGGVEALVSIAADAGDITNRSTVGDDRAKAIADIDRRIAMLTTTRDRLLELEERGADNVDSLVKITTELTRVQSELEELQGQAAHERERVDLDMLTVRFVVDDASSFWRPIGNAFSAFGYNLSRGMAHTITAIAYLLP